MRLHGIYRVVKRIADKNLLISILIFISLAYLTSCSNNRVDPVATENVAGDFGGWLASGGDGPNEIVEYGERLIFFQNIFTRFYGSFKKSLFPLAMAPSFINSVRVLGNSKGNFTVEYSDVIPDSLKNSSTNYYNLNMTFYDYSDDGRNYLGGKLSCSTSIKISTGGSEQADMLLDGGLVFAGDYTGSIEFDNFNALLHSDGKLVGLSPDSVDLSKHIVSGNIIIRSGDETFTFNPYRRLFPR